MCGWCSLLNIVDSCLEEDLETFKANVQDLVDELEEMRRECSIMIHKGHVTRLLFIITRCSRLVLTGEAPTLASSCLPCVWIMLHDNHTCLETCHVLHISLMMSV